jgi:flavin-dependent dehydrogenase
VLSIKTYDVIVVGAGPGGSACALMLVKAGYKVRLLEKAAAPQKKMGETVSGSFNILLEQLAVLDQFTKNNHLPSFSQMSSWGSELEFGNEAIKNPYGHGWHLDRKRFEQMWHTQCVSEGVELSYATHILEVNKQRKGGYGLKISHEGIIDNITCSFIVEASGRVRSFAKKIKIRSITEEAQVSYSKEYECNDLMSQPMTVESFENGWWYHAPLPSNKILVVMITDRNFMANEPLKRDQQWQNCFELTKMYKVGGNWRSLDNRLVARSASVSRLAKIGGQDWLSVGDAAVALDPLSGQGIEMAVRAGCKAAHAISHALNRNLDECIKYAQAQIKNYDEHLRKRKEYYRIEQRWPMNDFWNKRQN